MAAAPPLDPLDEQIEWLCSLMSEHVRTAHAIAGSSKEARVTKGWRGACRGLLTIDGYTSAQVEYAIAWVCSHHYWRNRIKSMTRLRSEMPQVAQDLRKEKERRQGITSPDPLAGYSASQRARLTRTADRLGVTIEQLQQGSRPTPITPGGSNANGNGLIHGVGREDAGSPRPSQPALGSGRAA